MDLNEMVKLAQRLADRHALEVLEACPLAWVRIGSDEQKAWLDTRPLRDVRLHAPEVLAMNEEALTWALHRELVAPAQLSRPWLVQPTPAALLAA